MARGSGRQRNACSSEQCPQQEGGSCAGAGGPPAGLSDNLHGRKAEYRQDSGGRDEEAGENAPGGGGSGPEAGRWEEGAGGTA